MTVRRLIGAFFFVITVAPALAQQPTPGAQAPPDPLPFYTSLVQKINRRLAEADARRVAGWIIADSDNAQIDPALLTAVMATDGSLQNARLANKMLVIGNMAAEHFIDTTARNLNRQISLASTNGQVTPAAITSALAARASAVIAGRRGGDQGVQSYVDRVERLYRQLLEDQAKAASEPQPSR
jgi:hypothetical protein